MEAMTHHSWWMVVAACAIVYAGALRCGFAFDDHLMIEGNRVVQAGTLRDIFGGEYWGTIAPRAQSHGYRPVTILTLRANHALSGLAPWSYHAMNVLLHALVSLAVLSVARRLGLPERAALAAALLFAVHALHTEAVTAIAGRAELLAALGVLAGLLVHDRGRPYLATGLFALGLLSKENAIVFPALALAWDVVRRRELRWTAYAAYGGVVVGFFALRLAVTGHAMPTFAVLPLDNPLASVSVGQRLLSATAVLGRYAILLVAPIRLSADYALGALPILRTPLNPHFMLGFLVIAGATAGAVALWRRRPDLSFALAALVLGFAPVSNIVIPIHTMMGERLAYLPSVGFCLLVAAVLRPGRAFRAALAIVLLGHAGRTYVRNADWKDDATLFSAAFRVTPGSARVANNYGNVLKLRGDVDGALVQFHRAAAIYPDYTDAYRNEYLTLVGLGRPREAARAAADGARALLRLGYPREALAAAADARRLDPQINLRDVEARAGALLGR